MQIKKVLQSGEVVRFHNHAGVDKQPIANHQWGVALIVQYLFPEATKKLILAALTHDAAEYVTGDIPAPVKWVHPNIKETLESIEVLVSHEWGIQYQLSREEKLVLGAADKLEGMCYCVQQLKQGNRSARRPYRKWRKAIEEMARGEENFLRDSTNFVTFLNMLETEKEKWDVS